MRFFFITLLFVILAACAVPTAQAQTTLTPSGNGGIQLSLGDNSTDWGFYLSQPGGNTGSNITLINPLNTGDCTPNGTCLMKFLNKILEFVIQIGAIAVVLMLVYVGYMFVIAQGNETKITDARKALLWTVIGALILLGSQAISLGIQATVQAISVGN